MNRLWCIGILFRIESIAVVDYLTVLYPNDPGSIIFSKFRVVGNHDDQTVFCDLFKKVHDLDARLGIECTRRLVCKKDLRVIYKSSRNGNSLHLTARHLIRLLVGLLAEADLVQRLKSPSLTLFAGDTGDRKRKLYIGQNSLVRDQVIALEYETDRVVSVGIPVPVLISLCGNAVDNEVSRIVAVETSDDVKQCRLA